VSATAIHAWLWLLNKEWRELLASRAWWVMLALIGPLGLDAIDVQLDLDPELPGVRVSATAKVVGRTGVEMEALTAVAVACLTVYDMVKAVDREMVIEAVRLVSKTGGTRGDWRRAGE
jgi:cyclic pyranopterin phosphate synthase